MKKSNATTFLSLSFLIVLVTIFMVGANKSAEPTEIITTTTQTETVSETSELSTTEPETTEQPTQNPKSVIMKNTLFIGDSRTVGLMEYGNISGADFFCTTGMSVFNVQKKTVSIPNVGKVTLSQLLNNKKYDTIYIMLGINELGYKFENIVAKYDELVKFVETNQPQSNIIILANLHVTKSRSDGDKYFNNTNINRLNKSISKFANGKNIFYLNGNSLFDDKNGALSADMSSDNTHLYGKHYKTWSRWIKEQTDLLF